MLEDALLSFQSEEKGFRGTYTTEGCSVGIPLFLHTLYTSAMMSTASTENLPFDVRHRGAHETTGEASFGTHGSRALASWVQAGLKFAASDQAVIEARARSLDSHSATCPNRNLACGAYHA